MHFFIVLFLFLIPQFHFTQQDEIILPELDLIIEDQSSLDTRSSEDAVLKERNPEFQEVYLDELMSGVADASLDKELSHRDLNRILQLDFSYGSFNNILGKAFAQSMISNIVYRLSYQGQYRQNVSKNGHKFENTGLYRNNLNLHLNANLKNTLFYLDLEYAQRNQHFITNTNHNQDTHYVPLTFTTKHWLNDYSHLDIKAYTGFTVLRQLSVDGTPNKHDLISSVDLDLAYKANFNEKNYFEIDVRYCFNDYSIYQANTGYLNVKNDFKINNLFTVRVGAGLVSSTENSFFGWPELAFIVNYMDLVEWDISVAGDFNLYNAQRASDEVQFYSLTPSPESRWIYQTSLKVNPHPIFDMQLTLAYSDYNAKRLYHYNEDTQLYSFNSIHKADIIEAGLNMNVKIENIFNMYVAYHYQHIPKDWLLYSPHKFEMITDIGYKPVGFNFRTQYTMYSDRLLRPTQISPMIHLLNIKVSQKIFKVAELFIEVNNLLNSDIQLVSGTYYGGIQANGGVTLNF